MKKKEYYSEEMEKSIDDKMRALKNQKYYIGTTNKERIKAAIESSNINIEKSDWFSLLVASQGHKVP